MSTTKDRNQEAEARALYHLRELRKALAEIYPGVHHHFTLCASFGDGDDRETWEAFVEASCHDKLFLNLLSDPRRRTNCER